MQDSVLTLCEPLEQLDVDVNKKIQKPIKGKAIANIDSCVNECKSFLAVTSRNSRENLLVSEMDKLPLLLF
ncbi:hypothetical protein Tco_0483582 [Tanacetum coccineum]